MRNDETSRNDKDADMTTHHSSFRTHHSRKAYPAYKPSGVDWLGDVPEHWEVLAFKRLGSSKLAQAFPMTSKG